MHTRSAKLALLQLVAIAFSAPAALTAGAVSPNDSRLALASPSASPKTVAAVTVDKTTLAAKSKPHTLVVAVTTDPYTSQTNGQLASMAYARALAAATGGAVNVMSYKSLREISRAAWAGELDAGWLPANIAIGLLNKGGYTLLGSDGKTVQIALLSTSRIQEPKDLIRKTLFLPQEDSLASHVGMAMLSERGVRLTDFASVHANGTYEVAQLAIASGINDVTAIPEAQALTWLKANPEKGRILGVSPEVPAQMLVARTSLDPLLKAKLIEWARSSLTDGGEIALPHADSLKYVSRLAHYTPDDLAGVARITAKEAKVIAAKGAAFVDVRTLKEFATKRIAGAMTVPYTEISGRVPGGTYSEDGFALTEVAAKEAIFYCNGPECWKSYKAAKRALDSKRFQRVFWLRGGLPEWEREGLPVTQG